jgi:hypothetical protein
MHQAFGSVFVSAFAQDLVGRPDALRPEQFLLVCLWKLQVVRDCFKRLLRPISQFFVAEHGRQGLDTPRKCLPFLDERFGVCLYEFRQSHEDSLLRAPFLKYCSLQGLPNPYIPKRIDSGRYGAQMSRASIPPRLSESEI